MRKVLQVESAAWVRIKHAAKENDRLVGELASVGIAERRKHFATAKSAAVVQVDDFERINDGLFFCMHFFSFEINIMKQKLHTKKKKKNTNGDNNNERKGLS